ncbi:porin, partial [Acinetobacter baumannii]
GPFKAQAEYYTSKAKRYDHDNYTSDGYYISGVWNVTGETWSYTGGTPGTGLPNNPAGGQWQLGVRYDHMDLNDGNLAANPVAGRP